MIFHLTGYGIATCIVIGFLLTPHWLDITAAWQSNSHYSDPLRVFNFTIWTALLLAFGSVFGGSNAHRHGGRSLVVRLRWALELFLCAPLICALTVASYWRSLLGSTKSKSELIFTRTPKGTKQNFTNRSDSLTTTIFTSLGWYFTWLAIDHELYFAAGMLGFQALLSLQILVASVWRGNEFSRIQTTGVEHRVL